MSFLLQALKGVVRFAPWPAATSLGTLYGGIIARGAAVLLRGEPGSYRGPRGLLLGLVLGFLPCGFLYAALMAAAATGQPLAGTLAMIGFGIGTLPALVTVGVLGVCITQRWRRIATASLPVIFLLNAVTLGGIALRLAA